MKTYPDGSHKIALTSKQVLDLARNQKRTVEASLIGNGLSATHFVGHVKGDRYWDEGIDSEERTVTRAEFFRDYPETQGYVWWVLSTSAERASGALGHQINRWVSWGERYPKPGLVFEVPPDSFYRQYGNFAVLKHELRQEGTPSRWVIVIWRADPCGEGERKSLDHYVASTPKEISNTQLYEMVRWSRRKHKDATLTLRPDDRTGYLVASKEGIVLEAAWDIVDGRIPRPRVIPPASAFKQLPVLARHSIMPSGITCAEAQVLRGDA